VKTVGWRFFAIVHECDVQKKASIEKWTKSTFYSATSMEKWTKSHTWSTFSRIFIF